MQLERLKADEDLWNGRRGAGGISWVERAQMGPFRGVIDAADNKGRRNAYMHLLHTKAVGQELRSLPRTGRALDFGCGTGRLLSTLAKRFDEVYALDTEPEMLRAARTYAGTFAQEFVVWNGGRTGFQGAFFDFVLCSSVLAVTADELFDASIAEMHRITKQGARLLLLEQVSRQRNLPLQRYRDALVNAGFAVLRAYPIRSATSLFTSLITSKPWIGGGFFGALASLEIALTSSGMYGSAEPYMEHVIVARHI